MAHARHQFTHARSGIAQVLRHHSLQTTALYGRVDLDRLRALAALWPGSTQR